MEDLNKIQEFFSKPLEEMMSLDDQAKAYYLEKLKKGEINNLPDNPKVAFLNQMTKDEIEKDATQFRREQGLEEMDINDPVMVRMRAAQAAKEKKATQPKKQINPEYTAVKNANKINFLKKERAQLMRDMEQEAEPEGGPIADEYGSKLNSIDAAIAKLSGRKEMAYDQAIAEAEDMFGLEENQTESKFKKGDKITYYGNKGVVNSAKYNPFAKDWDYTISYIEDGTRKGESGVRDKELKSSPIRAVGLDEKMLVPIDKIDRMARDIAAKYFKTKTDKFAAIEILKKAIKDSYKILDPDVEIREEEGYSKFLKDNPEFPGGKTSGLTPDVMSKILMKIMRDIDESKNPGLWDNIRAQRERGETPSRKGSKAYKTAVAAGKRINKKK